MTKRYYAKFHKGGFPDLYVVVDSHLSEVLTEPKPHHEAILEADARNEGKDITAHVAEGMGWGFIPSTIWAHLGSGT